MTRAINPLVADNKQDTIDQTHEFLKFLCTALDSDDDIPAGLLLSLHVVREAIKSLQNESEG